MEKREPTVALLLSQCCPETVSRPQGRGGGLRKISEFFSWGWVDKRWKSREVKAARFHRGKYQTGGRERERERDGVSGRGERQRRREREGG